MAEEKNERREFLKQSLLSATAGALTIGSSASVAGCVTAAKLEKLTWENRRQQFSLEANSIHLAPFLLASPPRHVLSRVDSIRQELDKNPARFLLENEHPLEKENRLGAARFLKAKTGEGVTGISLVENTTQALQIVYSGLIAKRSVGAGDEILTTTGEHFSSQEGMLRLARFATAKIVELDPLDPSFLERFEKGLNPRTRLVVMTWVHSETGVKLPIEAIGKIISAVNQKRSDRRKILYLVDGVHGLGTEPLSIQDFACDFFAAGCHKGLHGPRGTGLLWTSPLGRAALLSMHPSYIDKESWRQWRSKENRRLITTAESLTPGGYHSFENRWALHSAFEFHELLGRERIHSHIADLATRLRTSLKEVPNLELITPLEPDRAGAIVCWRCTKMSAGDLLKTLSDRRIYGSLSPYRTRFGRFGVGIVNTTDEIDHLVQSLKEILR